MTDSETVGKIAYTDDAGNAFIHKNLPGGDFYGVGFALQHTEGTNSQQYQYGGPYAAQARMPTTQPVSTATELVVSSQAPIALSLETTTQGKDS